MAARKRKPAVISNTAAAAARFIIRIWRRIANNRPALRFDSVERIEFRKVGLAFGGDPAEGINHLGISQSVGDGVGYDFQQAVSAEEALKQPAKSFKRMITPKT